MNLRDGLRENVPKDLVRRSYVVGYNPSGRSFASNNVPKDLPKSDKTGVRLKDRRETVLSYS